MESARYLCSTSILQKSNRFYTENKEIKEIPFFERGMEFLFDEKSDNKSSQFENFYYFCRYNFSYGKNSCKKHAENLLGKAS